MTTNAAATPTEIVEAPGEDSRPQRGCASSPTSAVLIVLLGFGAPGGGLIGLPISFFLKNKLHLKAHEVAIFRLIADIPLYLSFLFGFVRDTWNPFGMRDRGYMMLFGAVTAVLLRAFRLHAIRPT